MNDEVAKAEYERDYLLKNIKIDDPKFVNKKKFFLGRFFGYFFADYFIGNVIQALRTESLYNEELKEMLLLYKNENNELKEQLEKSNEKINLLLAISSDKSKKRII